jgi:hypothetical protein
MHGNGLLNVHDLCILLSWPTFEGSKERRKEAIKEGKKGRK